jgi:gluconate 2-dehydrogenase gamma chain
MSRDDDSVSGSRRRVIQSLGFVPLSVAALRGSVQAAAATEGTAKPVPAGTPYAPTFFNTVEWTFLQAACDRLIPADDVGPGALEAGVPEFIDRHMQTPYATGDLWYTQGPYLEAPPELGYQGRLTLRDLLRVGFKSVDAHCLKTAGGKTFAQLASGEQEAMLKQLESGKLPLADVPPKEFFNQLLNEVRAGYFCDPRHGGNKDMGAWKMIGYPGMRADYLDWVEVRDRPYPLPPVDLSGRRG